MSRTWKTQSKRDFHIAKPRPSWETKTKRTRDYLTEYYQTEDETDEREERD